MGQSRFRVETRRMRFESCLLDTQYVKKELFHWTLFRSAMVARRLRRGGLVLLNASLPSIGGQRNGKKLLLRCMSFAAAERILYAFLLSLRQNERSDQNRSGSGRPLFSVLVGPTVYLFSFKAFLLKPSEVKPEHVMTGKHSFTGMPTRTLKDPP